MVLTAYIICIDLKIDLILSRIRKCSNTNFALSKDIKLFIVDFSYHLDNK